MITKEITKIVQMPETPEEARWIYFVNNFSNIYYTKEETIVFWQQLLQLEFFNQFKEENIFSYIEYNKFVSYTEDLTIPMFINISKTAVYQIDTKELLYERVEQKDGVKRTPYEQAKFLTDKLPYDDRPRWIVVCDFQNIVIYDMNTFEPQHNPVTISLEELDTKYEKLYFLFMTPKNYKEISLELKQTTNEINKVNTIENTEQTTNKNEPQEKHIGFMK